MNNLTLKKLLSRQGKTLFNLPSVLILVTALIAFIILIYFTFLILTWTGIRYNVTVYPDYLEIIGPSPEPSEVFKELAPGDRIVAINDLPVKSVLHQGGETELLLYSYLDKQKEFGLAGYRLKLPLPEGTPALLWGIRAGTLSLDYSNRTGNATKELTFINRPGVTRIEPGLVRLNLSELPANEERNLLTLVLLVVALSFCGLGVFFYLVRPSYITGVYCLLNLAVSLEMIVSSIDRSYLDTIEKLALVFNSPAIGILFWHFMLLFPRGGRLSKRARYSLTAGYLVTAILVLLHLFTTFYPATPPLFEAELLVKKINYLWVFIESLIALGLLFYKYFHSQGYERLKIRLATLAFLGGVFIPLLALLNYFIVSLWQPVIYEQFGIFFLPCVVIPPTFGYAVIKNELLGVSLRVRRLVVHAVLTFLIVVSYLILSTLLTALLPIWRDLSSQPVAVALVLAIMTMSLYQLRFKTQVIVDRAFKVDPLDYGRLQNDWSGRLVKTVELSRVLATVIKQLPEDFHYRQGGLLIWHPVLLDRSDLLQQPGKNALLAFESRQSLELQPVSLDITPEFKDRLEKNRFLVLGQEPGYPELAPLSFLEPNFVFPLQMGDELYGLLALGEKYTEFLPAREELENISLLAGQIAMSFYNSVLLSTQTVLRRFYEETLNLEERTREQERLKISGLLHDEVLQQLYALRRELDLIGMDLESEKLSRQLTLSRENVLDISRKLRNINLWLVPSGLREDLVGQLQALYQRQQEANPSLKFHFYLEGNRRLLEKLLDSDLKLTVYRLIEEATGNAIKHAEAENIQAYLRLLPQTEGPDQQVIVYNLLVEVIDDGVGIDPAYLQQTQALLRQKHFGLSSLKRRVELHRGEVEFISRPGYGLQIIATIPVVPGSQRVPPTFEELQRAKS